MKKILLAGLSVLLFVTPYIFAKSGVLCRNPRVYNVDYSFEMVPDPNKIDRAKDLKLWIPVPREWDSQKAVKIISVQPPPNAEYEEPEHRNRMLFWDFSKEPEQSSYKVDIRFRLESYEVHVEVDPEQIGSYDKESEKYRFYTRSTYKTNITPKIRELAQTAVGNEKNAYLQAKRIFEFVREKMRYKRVKHERGSGTECLLDFPVTDPKTGEQYFEGQCNHYSVFFVALCRAVGIPARGVNGMVGWGPWIKEKDLKLRSKIQTKLTPDGLAATRLYGPMGGHIWAEFYHPNYGWIPVDPTWGRFGHQGNNRLIFSKGRDVKIGPYAPREESEGYGEQWIPLHNGRADVIVCGAWNIARIRIAKAKILHHSDPFPADAFTDYPVVPYTEDAPEHTSSFDGRQVLSSIDNLTRGQPDKGEALAQAYKQESRLQYRQKPFICHMLRAVVGDKKFYDIFETYTNLRVKSGEPVSTQCFQKIAEKIYGKPLDWFFKQWLKREELPQLKLENVNISKEGKKWHIQGSLCQLSDSVFQLPVELAIETEEEKEFKCIWLDTRKASFEFNTLNKPKRITVDPELDILKIQKMPPRLGKLWDVYPELLVVYGTLSEGQANKATAERFNKEYLGLEDKIIKADTDVNEADLKTKCLILFGRPETNKIAQQFKDNFPIEFNDNKFTYQGVTYDQPTQGVAQIVENPNDPQSLMIMYAGLSSDATQKICDKSEWRAELNGWFIIDLNASYIIYNKYKKLVSGDWEDFNSDLVWRTDDSSSPDAAKLP